MGFFDFIKKAKSNQNERIKQDLETIKNGNWGFESEIVEEEVISVEERIKGINPNSEGLYPHEILVLSYAPNYYVDGNNEFQGFWWYKYGIKDVNKILESLLNRDFLREGSLVSSMWKATVVELKDILRENDKKVSGKKEVLIQRLLDEVEEEKLNKVFKRRTYEVTDLGKEVLKNEEHISYIHKHTIEDLDIFSLSKMLENKPIYLYRDIIWGYLNEKGMEYIKDNNFGLYRNCRLTMSEFVKEEGKIDYSFTLLVEVIRYDLSGLHNGFDMSFLRIYKDRYIPYKKSLISVPPGIVNQVVEYKETKGFTDDELRQKIVENAEELSLPFSVFTADECADIVIMEMNDEKEGLSKIYYNAEKDLVRNMDFNKI